MTVREICQLLLEGFELFEQSNFKLGILEWIVQMRQPLKNPRNGAHSVSKRTLSVGNVAGLESPALLDRLVVSISSGANRLFGFGVSGVGLRGLVVDTGVGSGVGRAAAAFPGSLLDLKLVSIGIGRKRFFAKSLRSTAESLTAAEQLPPFLSCCLLLLVVVSTGSGANLRTFLTLSSIGVGWKRREGGGEDDILGEETR